MLVVRALKISQMTDRGMPPTDDSMHWSGDSMTADWVSQQLRERQIPRASRPVMFHRWTNLLFLHWRRDPDEIAKFLPSGLIPDLFEGSAWVGVVPFFMRSIRPAWLPPVPGLSYFLELNLRTYVRDQEGRSGVWFFSLDANQPLAVWMARLFFALPYQHAQMRAALTGRSSVEYQSRRGGISLEFHYRPVGKPFEAKPGSKEFFLIERYQLFTRYGNQLLSGRVYHSPYPLQSVSVTKWDARLFALNGLAAPTVPPDHLIFSSGVDVSVYPIARLAAGQ